MYIEQIVNVRCRGSNAFGQWRSDSGCQCVSCIGCRLRYGNRWLCQDLVDNGVHLGESIGDNLVPNVRRRMAWKMSKGRKLSLENFLGLKSHKFLYAGWT